MSLTAHAANRKDTRNASADDVMQHRHYAVVAGIIAQLPTASERLFMAAHFADRLAGSNRNFNRQRFIAACTPTGGR